MNRVGFGLGALVTAALGRNIILEITAFIAMPRFFINVRRIP
jgi:hypothetical protein